MTQKLLTVIIPCYNGFHLMARGFASLEKMKSGLLEVIIVDDCSTDDSFERLCEYKKTSDLDIKLLKNKNNEGPGISRNIGLSQSTGEYVTFLDADDFFEEDFREKIFPVLEEKHDCVVFDAYVSADHRRHILSMFHVERMPGKIEPEDAIVFLKGGTLGKVYQRRILIENKVGFLAQKRCEDIAFTKSAVSYCNDIVYLKLPLYNYVQHEESLMHDSSLTNPVNAENAFRSIKDRIGKRYPAETEAVFIWERLYTTVLQQISFLNKKELSKYIDEAVAEYPLFLKNKYYPLFPKRIRTAVGLINKKSFFALKLYFGIKKLYSAVMYHASIRKRGGE